MHNISVLQECKQKGYPWVTEAEKQIRDTIAYYAKNLTNEAIGCNCVDILDEKRMYERFVKNCENEEEYANKYICKFFLVKMIIKCLFWSLGIWKFTEHDKEMLQYFHEHKTALGLNRKAFAFKFAEHNKMSSATRVLDDINKNYTANVICTETNGVKFDEVSVYNFDPFCDLEDVLNAIQATLLGFSYNKDYLTKLNCRNMVDLVFNWLSMHRQLYIICDFKKN